MIHLAAVILGLAVILPPVHGLIGDSLGCFEDKTRPDKLVLEISASNSSDTVENCISSCLKNYYRYARLRNARKCLCSSDNSGLIPGTCNNHCRLNTSQPCGGPRSSNVYDTGQRVSGPPGKVLILSVSEVGVSIKWTPPLASNGVIGGYFIATITLEMPSPNLVILPREWLYPKSSNRAQLIPLHPGTKYNLTVNAVTEAGYGVPASVIFWTLIGEPEVPDVPTIVRRGRGQIVVKISPGISYKGPISLYQIIVVDESIPTPFVPTLLKSSSEAQNESLPYYIAAELTPDQVTKEFVVGDGQMYGGYYNPPLPDGGDIHINLGVVSAKDGIRKSSYARATHRQHGVVVLDVATEPSSKLVTGLSIAIGIFGFLLLLSVLVFFMLRYRVGQRRRQRLPDLQELSLQGPMVEVEPNGYVHSSYIPDETEERVDHYENLTQQVWNIPRDLLDVKPDLLGCGRYGHVKRGTVKQGGFPVPVAIHVIADVSLGPQDKRSMLQDLDVLIKAGKHDNILTLVGTCENPDMLFVAVEHHPASLKDILLESRVLDHSPEQRHQLNRFCSLKEQYLLNVALGVSKGMDYLASKKIVHKTLAARNVMMSDGIVPKIGGYGLTQMTKALEKPSDFTRWTAQEIFRSRHFVSKSDVWSFGVLLWEIAVLGGTPYNDVPTRDLPARVMRGLILPQPRHVGDDFYQLMLQCWQVDLDERPQFQEISQILDNLIQDPLVHLNFEVYLGFNYDKYLSDSEKLS